MNDYKQKPVLETMMIHTLIQLLTLVDEITDIISRLTRTCANLSLMEITVRIPQCVSHNLHDGPLVLCFFFSFSKATCCPIFARSLGGNL